ncbi:MAG: hypothetical protein J6A83_01895 [Clostridia bacterium]|nr:hypothetical protein [Clostridia bacterium]
MDEKNQEILKIGFTAGTKAIDIYDNYCSKFGFKRSLRGNFAMMKLLYAKNATPEGYSVWMIAHSSLNESYLQAKSSGRKWYNKFISPNIIKKIWINPSEYIEDSSIRVTFAKNKRGNYVFQGIYRPIKTGWEDLNTGRVEWVRTFERISDIYPTNIIAADSSTINSPKFNEPAEISHVIDRCQIKAKIVETNKDTSVNVDFSLRPFQKVLIGKKVGDIFTLPNVKLTYEIKQILIID